MGHRMIGVRVTAGPRLLATPLSPRRPPTLPRGNQSLYDVTCGTLAYGCAAVVSLKEVLGVEGRAERFHIRRRDLATAAALRAHPPDPIVACELWVNFPTTH